MKKVTRKLTKSCNMKTKLFAVILLVSAVQLFSQQYLERQFKGYTNPDEIVTLAETLPFNQAVELLSKVSESTTGKRIISTVDLNEPVGMQIENMAYDKALVVLTQLKGLMYEEKEDVIIIKRKNEPQSVAKTKDIYAPVTEREVKISAVFFEMDANESRKTGIDWQLLLSGRGFSVNSLLGVEETDKSGGTGTGGSNQQQQQQLGTFEIGGEGEFSSGSFFGKATAIFKFFENENMGEIIASPNITVRNGNLARLQAGQDISVKQRDFAGNVVEEFFSTGTILNVTPYVYSEEGVDYILLNIEVERSSFVPDQLQTIINKTEATTQVLMLNGEETVIGGLFVNDETVIRNGIPILKDLPWWVFGLRYIFGSDETVTSKKELVILLKAELMPTLKERLAFPQSTTPLKDELKKQREKIKYYQFNQLPTNEN